MGLMHVDTLRYAESRSKCVRYDVGLVYKQGQWHGRTYSTVCPSRSMN
jgi:hypothetical protein